MPADGKEEMEKILTKDETLEKIRKYADGEVEGPQGMKYVKRDGLLFKRLEVLDEELFGKPGKVREQKRKEKETWQQESAIPRRNDLPAGKEEIEKLQTKDETLEKIWKYASGEVEGPPGMKYVKRNGLLFKRLEVLDEELFGKPGKIRKMGEQKRKEKETYGSRRVLYQEEMTCQLMERRRWRRY